MHCYITLHCYITNMDRISRGSYKSGTLLWTHRYIATSFFGMRYNIYRDFHNKCPSKVCWRLLQNICWALHTWGIIYLCICVFLREVIIRMQHQVIKVDRDVVSFTNPLLQ